VDAVSICFKSVAVAVLAVGRLRAEGWEWRPPIGVGFCRPNRCVADAYTSHGKTIANAGVDNRPELILGGGDLQRLATSGELDDVFDWFASLPSAPFKLMNTGLGRGL